MSMMPMQDGGGFPQGMVASPQGKGGGVPSRPMPGQGIPPGMPAPFGGNPQLAAMQSAMQGKSGGTPQPPQRATIQPVMGGRNALLSALQSRMGRV
jgi:hypothetical protein